jgi:hypothetical protein
MGRLSEQGGGPGLNRRPPMRFTKSEPISTPPETLADCASRCQFNGLVQLDLSFRVFGDEQGILNLDEILPLKPQKPAAKLESGAFRLETDQTCSFPTIC